MSADRSPSSTVPSTQLDSARPGRREDQTQQPAVGCPQLVADLTALGLHEGDTVMVHTRMSVIGWVVGGAPAVVEALLKALGSSGTLLVLTGWQDRPPYHQHGWDPAQAAAYERDCPPFNPRLCRAETDHGRIPELVRTWPGAAHSIHPVGSFAAVGARALHLTRDQSLDESFGPASPLERLVEANGKVLLLGAPLDSVTLLHYAEYLAEVPEKRHVEYHMPVVVDGYRQWRAIRELDSTDGAFCYEDLPYAEDAFAVLTAEAIAAGLARTTRVGQATSHLFGARQLLAFAIRWLERHFAA